MPGVVGVGNASLVEGSIEAEAHVAHELIHGVAGHLGELYLVCLVVLHLLAEHLCFGWGIQPLFREFHLRTERILLNGFVYALLLDLLLFALVLADLYLFL